MAAPATEHVRNIVLVGQDGAGKTSLAEAMLHVSGKTPRMGTTHDGKSYLDYDEEEIRRHFTLGTSIAPIPYKDYKINLLDTSGQPDFLGDTLATMQAAEMAMFIVDAVDGPQVMTTRLWHEAETMRLCRCVFINHIDREHANFDVAMATLHARFGDEDLMMKYLDGEEQLTQEELEQLLDKAIAQEIFIPVFVGSTIIKQGIKGLMEDIASYFPHPRAHGPFYLANGEELYVDETGEPAGFVFKTLSDPYVGRMSFIKVLSGYLEPGMELTNARSKKKERLSHLYVMMGKEPMDVKSAKAGDIIVVPKINETKTGDTLSLSGNIEVDPLPSPVPLYPIALEAENKKDEDKLGTFLSKQAEIDPTLRLVRYEETHQQVVFTMGDMHVDVLLNKLKNQAKIEAHLVPVRIPYRETIQKTAEAEGRHKKQTGGSGQFGDCWLRLSPNPGEGYAFESEVVGGRIPKNLIPAVDKGVQETMAEGFLAGYPMVDIKCVVFDGSYHAVDSNEMAFKTAARLAFRAACQQADPIILEPMADMDITVGEAYAGAVMGDISTRRGRIVGTDSNDEGETIIVVRVPYAEVLSYTKDLRALSRGSGTYSVRLNGYEPAPYDVQKKLVELYEASRK